MTDLITMRDRPPRIENRTPAWGRLLCMGLLIDWLDSRPEHAAKDNVAVTRKAVSGDMVALAAAVITERLGVEWANFDGPIDHRADYNVTYHAQITGHLTADELAFGEQTYRRLNDVLPGCMSALVNLAEVERRAGRDSDAQALLQAALERTSSTSARRYSVADSAWNLDIRCALARLGRDIGEGEPLLDNASRERITDLVAQLRGYGSWERAALPAHQAFSVASAEQRIVLHAAMRLAHVWPSPPPAAHGDVAAIGAVDELVKQLTPNAKPLVPRGRPGPLASLILWLARRRDR